MHFISLKKHSLLVISILLTIFLLNSCKDNKEEKQSETAQEKSSVSQDSLFFKISLAEWSLHEPIQSGKMDPMDFAEKAHDMGFSAIEYVTSFYGDSIKNAKDPEAKMKTMLDTLLARSKRFKVRNWLMMVDAEGELAVQDSVTRNQAVENHKKWVDAANFLGCSSIRVNLFGGADPEVWKNASVDALKKLSKYAKSKNINILVENHGYLSSNADLLAEVMKEVNMDNCGTLPDFGNFCLKREGNARWDAKCIEEYPRYEGVQKMMPFAKAVSAKSYSFDNDGREELIDYKKMLQIVKDAGYHDYVGIEYEGTGLTPEEGINATRDLLIKAANQLN